MVAPTSGQKRVMADTKSFPADSIILEWETGSECGERRAERCLRELNRQIARAREATELILVQDPLPEARRSAEDAARG